MIKIENVETMGWEHAIRGMRNPMNSWNKSGSSWTKTAHEDDLVTDVDYNEDEYGMRFVYVIGENDQKLMRKLANSGTADHRKFMRMITVYLDITAPLYWWKEFSTYKVGTVANSCSTMHKIADKEFELDDFSHEHLYNETTKCLSYTIKMLNSYREYYLDHNDKEYWWQMIQLLPSSYNQKRTVMLNYEVLRNMYTSRKNHKLDEWQGFCTWIKTLPYSELITGETKNIED